MTTPPPDPREALAEVIERSSFGTPEAKAARETVSDEQVARVLARVKELDAETLTKRVPSANYDALVHLCETVINVHAQVVMDTPDARELHDQAVATFRARLTQLTLPAKGE